MNIVFMFVRLKTIIMSFRQDSSVLTSARIAGAATLCKDQVEKQLSSNAEETGARIMLGLCNSINWRNSHTSDGKGNYDASMVF